jgi:Mrp family chromosome partitioning ATPase/predicted Fe-Mo cluster-binding NifX family protein
MSGKGGVGKTTVAVNLAHAFAALGVRAGILDVDLHGPNVALMTGLEGRRLGFEADEMIPAVSEHGIRVVSIAALLDSPDTPVIWRGPRKMSAITQFLAQVRWEGIDVLVVDCPPGTGDEPLSVAQLLPESDGVVIVTTPQAVSLLDSRKCVNFVRQLDLPVLGILENMSGFACPSCGHEILLFKRGGGEEAAKEMGVPFLGRLPITPAMVESSDSGKPLVVDHPDDPAAQALAAAAKAITEGWGKGTGAKEAVGMKTASKTLKVAVACEDGRGLEGEVSAHFGRCPFYAVVEVGDAGIGKVEVIANPHYENHQPGTMPRFVQGLGADVILAGGMGPRAVDMFEAMGIEVATGAIGNVRRVLEAWMRGELRGTQPCAHDHPDSCGGHDHDPPAPKGGGCGHGCGGH